MGRLVNDLLAFSRLSRKDLKMTRLSLRNLVEDAKRQVEADAIGRIIRWDVGELPLAFGDEAMLREVLINLFANAVKFTRPREEAVIGIDGHVEGNDVVLTVRDNGVGFDMAYKDKLFCVFQRLHTADEFEGTGIGLALVKRIIQRHGGGVWAEGKLNEGATFHFTLPGHATEERRAPDEKLERSI
jgi:light-regulated signal transduction histidine kinase (bacteriophytochrome)